MTTLRCCAVAFRLDVERATSIATFRAAVAEVVDTHVVPHPHAPTLVAFPEHTGLLAMFVGAAGEAARARLAAGASTVEAMTALAFGYGDELGQCAQAFPEVRSSGQLLHLACTDTLVQTLLAAFGTLAAERGLWVSVGAALPRWASRPPDGPARRLPDGPATMVPAGVRYVATGPEVRNRNLLFAPDGTLAAVHDKAYLVPVEHDAEGGLGLAPAGIAEVVTTDLPFGRVASVISKDAWMPDVNDRLDQLGAQVLIQPEAFDRWGAVDRADGLDDLWPPDKFQRGGWWMVQRHPAFRVNLAPMLVGNLGDLTFDGQPLIAVPAPGGHVGLGLLGQPHDVGWAAVGGWDHLDEPASSLADVARRAEFEERASRLAPTSGDPLEGAVAETAVWADINLPARPAPCAAVPPLDPAPPSVSVGGAGPASGPRAQLAPDLATDGRGVWLAWVASDDRRRQSVVVAELDAQGRRAPEPVAPTRDQLGEPGRRDGTDRRWRPRLSVVHGTLVCLELGFPAGSWDLFATRRAADGGWGAPVRVDDAHADHGVRRERGHDAPILLADGDTLIAVWSDLRWPWVFPQIRLARSMDAGRRWSASRRVDGGSLVGEPDPLAPRSRHETRGQTAPCATVAADGTLLVAWQEQGDTGTGLHLVRLDASMDRDRPERPSAPTVHRLDRGVGVGEGAPRRAARPVLGASGSAVWLVWEEWASDGGAALMSRCSSDTGRTWSEPFAVDRSRKGGTTQRRATVVTTTGNDAMVVFEDDRTGESRVVTARLGFAGPNDPAGTTGPLAGPVRRVDDAPDEAHARAPTAVLVGGELVIAWQDTRGGWEHVRTTRLPVRTVSGGDG